MTYQDADIPEDSFEIPPLEEEQQYRVPGSSELPINIELIKSEQISPARMMDMEIPGSLGSNEESKKKSESGSKLQDESSTTVTAA